MPIHVRDLATDRLVRRLAAKSGMGLTEAIRTAVEHELQRLETAIPLPERVAAIRRRIAPRLRPAEQTDKQFFDELSGDD
jgi:antitoxin VapB